MEKETQTPQEPVVSDEEMKMPEENFGNTGAPPENTSHLGVILGILIVILILILGGLYLWGSTIQKGHDVEVAPTADRPTAEENNEPESANAEADVETMQALSTSNEIEAIEADIESTNLDQLDAELDAIDAELDAALQGL